MHTYTDSRLNRLFAACSRALGDSGSVAEDACGFWVPGRLEVLGKHTDYAGGRSLLGAVERGFCVLAAPRADRWVTLTDADTGEQTGFPLSENLRIEPGRWTSYSMTLARRLVRNFPGAWKGADIAFASNLPSAAGLSSSSALLTGTFLALAAVNDLESNDDYRANIDGEDELAEYLAAVESGRTYGSLEGDEGVGTRGGSEDHTAILLCRPDELIQYSFDPPGSERIVPVPDGYVFVVGSSGVRAVKSGSARDSYNRAADLARRIVEIANREMGASATSLGTILGEAPDAAARIREIVRSSPALTDRLDQFVAETYEIIPAAAEALANGRLDDFGDAVDRSQALAERKLGNQVPETIHLAASARRRGAVAASAFGAGFGGSVWAMVHADDAPRFLIAWRDDYLEHFPECAGQSEFFVTGAGSAARRIQ